MDRTVALSSTYEARVLERYTKPFILPVTIITGFLGAGKSTLLSSLVKKKRNLRLVTLINDFGAFNHDAELVGKHKPDRMIELHSGCICCSHLTQCMRDEIWDLLGTQEDQIDYLVIETSGVTDPHALIAILDEKFGKMTRARLDSIVTVVDMDTGCAAALDPSAPTEFKGAVALRRQIKVADVILMNKVDLVAPERVEEHEAAIRRLNPTAKIYRTSYCDLPLHFVLDVEVPAEGGASALTHEAGGLFDFKSREADAAARLRSEASISVSKQKKLPLSGSSPQQDESSALPHLSGDGFDSCTFTSSRPFHLERLQAFLALVLPDSVVRTKGALYIKELGAAHPILLSLSGRRRISLTYDGSWAGVPSSRVVFIGTGLDKAALMSALEAACAGDEEPGGLNTGTSSASFALARRLRDAVLADERFDLLDARDVAGFRTGLDGLICFRISGARALGVTAEHLRLQHAVDVGVMNEQLQQRVNMLGRKDVSVLMLTPAVKADAEGCKDAEPVLTFGVPCCPEECTGVPGELDYLGVWSIIAEVAAEVMQRNMSHVKLCKCGH